jgi:hypothetical protein
MTYIPLFSSVKLFYPVQLCVIYQEISYLCAISYLIQFELSLDIECFYSPIIAMDTTEICFFTRSSEFV